MTIDNGISITLPKFNTIRNIFSTKYNQLPKFKSLQHHKSLKS